MGHAIFVEWHTKTFNSLNLSVCQDFSWGSGNSEFFAIKMFNLHGDSSESFQQTDFLYDNEISSSSLEGFVFFDSDSGVNVTSDDSGLNKI